MTLKIALAQLNLTVGDIEANCQKIIRTLNEARQVSADLVVFPELTVTGYPPEDLLFRQDFLAQSERAIQQILAHSHGITAIIGAPVQHQGQLYNAALALRDGHIVAEYHKQALPNYGVFDEQRYFTAGQQTQILSLKGLQIGLTVCEDIWQEGIIAANRQAGAELIVTLNASPFHAGKVHQREEVIAEQVKAAGIPLVYVNQVGGQDELIFDGASFALDQEGQLIFRAAEFTEQLNWLEWTDGRLQTSCIAPHYQPVVSEYQALILGIRDYVRKNGFKGAILGLSGGIDSALVLALAVDALGAEQVEVVLMPSRYTHDMSVEDAVLEADALGVKHHIIAIEPAVQAFNQMLAPVFAGSKTDTTEENIQARCRGVLLMALSNKQGKLLLTTGNKSEMSVGYATLYGDMAGGFAPLKDVSKLLVYEMARYRNTLSAVIPERVIIRPPSAELAPDQKDEDSLPPYDVLDPILALYVEQDKSASEIVALGYPRPAVERAISLVDRNEYKRRQSPPGIRITPRAFGRDRRYPISSGYRGIAELD